MAVSASLTPPAHAPTDAIDWPNAAKKARKAPRSTNRALLANTAVAKMISVATGGNDTSKMPESVGDLLGSDEVLLLDHELSRPHRKCPNGCGGDAEFADSRDQLQHEAADLALQIEVPGLVIKPYR